MLKFWDGTAEGRRRCQTQLCAVKKERELVADEMSHTNTRRKGKISDGGERERENPFFSLNVLFAFTTSVRGRDKKKKHVDCFPCCCLLFCPFEERKANRVPCGYGRVDTEDAG